MSGEVLSWVCQPIAAIRILQCCANAAVATGHRLHHYGRYFTFLLLPLFCTSAVCTDSWSRAVFLRFICRGAVTMGSWGRGV